MKWTNKGHQYDEIGKLFENIEKLYIYGAGSGGEYVYEHLKFLDCVTAFIDFDEQKQKNGFMGKPVLSFQGFLTLDRENSIIIISVEDNLLIKTNLISYGFREGINFFDRNSFIRIYLPIFALYRYDKLYIKELALSITQRCTLRCKHCIMNAPYIENPQDISFEVIVYEIDATFKRFDYVDTYNLSGGEATLNSDLYKIIKYLLDNYSSQFRRLVVFSNGFSKISENLLDLFRHPSLFFMWTNYLDNLTNEKIISVIKNNIDNLKSAGVKVFELIYDYWSDFKFGKITSEESEEELIEFYDNCKRCIGVIGNRFYPCILGAIPSTKVEGIENFSINLFADTPRQKHILMESIFGFTPTGYVEGCKHCTSYMGIGDSRVDPGVQLL